MNTVIPQNVKLAYKRGLKRVDFMTRSKFGLGHNDHNLDWVIMTMYKCIQKKAKLVCLVCVVVPAQV